MNTIDGCVQCQAWVFACGDSDSKFAAGKAVREFFSRFLFGSEPLFGVAGVFFVLDEVADKFWVSVCFRPVGLLHSPAIDLKERAALIQRVESCPCFLTGLILSETCSRMMCL